MRTILLLVYLTVSSLSVISQSISVKYLNNSLNNGDSINVFGGYFSSLYCYLKISNNSNKELSIKCKKMEPFGSTGSSSCFYWGAVIPNNLNNPGAITLPALTTDSSLFLGIYQAIYIGYYIVDYTFFVSDSVNDSTTIRVKYEPIFDWEGIGEYTRANIKVFPNPTTDIVNFSNLVMDFKLYSISGQLLISVRNTKCFDLSSLSKGVYFAEIDNNVTKIVKQ